MTNIKMTEMQRRCFLPLYDKHKDDRDDREDVSYFCITNIKMTEITEKMFLTSV